MDLAEEDEAVQPNILELVRHVNRSLGEKCQNRGFFVLSISDNCHEAEQILSFYYDEF
jgi:hypothetical protein